MGEIDKQKLNSEELNGVAGGTDRWYICVECGNRAKMNSDRENSWYNPLKCPECGGKVVRN